jgi:hypothetical protein
MYNIGIVSNKELVMRSPKYSGHKQNGGSGVSKHGKSWLTRAELNHMKWYAEVMNSKKNRGDRSPVNMD